MADSRTQQAPSGVKRTMPTLARSDLASALLAFDNDGDFAGLVFSALVGHSGAGIVNVRNRVELDDVETGVRFLSLVRIVEPFESYAAEDLLFYNHISGTWSPLTSGVDEDAVNALIAAWWDNLETVPDGKLPFIVRDFRAGVPAPLPTNSPQAVIDKAKRTIGIGKRGINYTFEHTDDRSATSTWIDFDNDSWQFEQSQPLPRAALETGDFYYIPNAGTSPARGFWYLYDGTRVVEYEDVNTFLPNHHFLGNFTSRQAAADAITSYDANTTYLAYFPTVVEGRSGREVQQLTAYTPGMLGANRWVPSDEELHSLIGHVESEITDLRNSINETLRTQSREIDTANTQRFPFRLLGTWNKDTGTSGEVGTGDIRTTATTVSVHHTDASGVDRSGEIAGVFINHGLQVGTQRFVITNFVRFPNHSDYTGYWVDGVPNNTPDNGSVIVRYITKDSRFGRWVNAEDIVGLEEEIEEHGTGASQVSDRDALRGSNANPHTWSSRQVRINVEGAFTGEASDDPELDTLHIRYAAVDYDQTAYNANDLAFAQMMFNNATLASADKLKIGYIRNRRIADQLDLLVAGSKIELANVNDATDYEEPDRVFTANITAVARVERTGLEEISTIELTLDANPSFSVGLGANTEYFVSISGRFKDRVVPPIANSDRGKVLGVKTDANETEFVEVSGPQDGITAREAAGIASTAAEARYTDAEKAKVASVEENATADQTGAEIKAAYEGEADTNAFTDAEKSKLAGLSGGGSTTEENRFARLAVDPAANTNIRFIVAGQGGRPALDQFPQRDGTSFLIDYRQAAGRLIVFDPSGGTGNFEINLQDLIAIRTQLIGTDLDGSTFLIANKSSRTGVFTANPAIAEVFPSASVSLPPNSLALLTMNSIGANGPSQTYELIVQPLGGQAGEDDKEPLFGTAVPAGSLGVVGDAYLRTTNGQWYKKTASATWTAQVNVATQAELDAVKSTIPAVTNTDIDTDTPGNEPTNAAASRRAIATEIRRVEQAGGGGDTPRRVTTLPSSPYTIGDMVYLTATDGSNAPGLYMVFNTANGYERAEVSRERRVLLAWNVTRVYADITLPADYQDYREFVYGSMNVTNVEYFDRAIPIAALVNYTQGNDGLGWNQADRIRFNPTTRVISRAITGSTRLERFTYAELR